MAALRRGAGLFSVVDRKTADQTVIHTQAFDVCVRVVKEAGSAVRRHPAESMT